MISSIPTMFSVQTPWALITLLALVIPIAIHLISKGRATLIKFANVSLITAVKPKNMRQILLTEFWLLMLRLLLLIVATLLLAQVFFIEPTPVSARASVVTTQWLNSSNNLEREELIALNSDAPIYLLSANSQPISKMNIVQWQNNSESSKNKTTANNTYLNLYYLINSFSSNTSIDLFVTDNAAQYAETDFKQNDDIQWHIKHTALATSVTSDNKQYPESVAVVIIYDQDRAEDIQYFQQALKAIKRTSAPKLVLQSFLNDKLENNALYQQALTGNIDWIFYLSSAEPDNYLVTALTMGTNVLIDGKNAASNLMSANSIEITQDSAIFSPIAIQFFQRAIPLNIFQHLPVDSFMKTDEILWQAFGQSADQNSSQSSGQSREAMPLLIKSALTFKHDNLTVEPSIGSKQKKRHVYQLYSRFSPSWSNLLTTKHFPVLLQNMLFDDWQQKQMSEQFQLTREQITRFYDKNDNTELEQQSTSAIELSKKENNLTNFEHLASITNQNKNTNLAWTSILTCLLIILWFAERLMSEITLTNSTKKLTSKLNEDRLDEVSR